MGETLVPAVLSIYNDRSFTFILKTPPASELIKKAAGVVKGSGVPNKEKVGSITNAQVAEIAKTKLPDLNTTSIQAAEMIIKGTARSMGVDIKD
jgi:large subunit ribosomal protein L11